MIEHCTEILASSGDNICGIRTEINKMVEQISRHCCRIVYDTSPGLCIRSSQVVMSLGGLVHWYVVWCYLLKLAPPEVSHIVYILASACCFAVSRPLQNYNFIPLTFFARTDCEKARIRWYVSCQLGWVVISIPVNSVRIWINIFVVRWTLLIH